MQPAETTYESARTPRTSAYLDVMQMLSGAALILFMVAHLTFVASVIISPSLFTVVAWFLEATYMAQIGGPVIVLIFLFHFVLAARKVPFRAQEQRIIWKHSRQMRHEDTWLWLVQVVTGMIILLMGSIHLWVTLTDLPITVAKSAAYLQNAWWMLFYLAFIIMVALHMGAGFYRIAVKWGLSKRFNRAKFKKLSNYIIGGYIIIGLLILLRFFFAA